MRDLDERIQRYRWALQCVTGPRPWIYTIGLTERFEHPELVIAGIDLDVAGEALNALGARVANGEQFLPGDTGELFDTPIELRAVHPVHIADGLVGMWEERYAQLSGDPPPLEVVQVVRLPRHGQPLLDRPHTNLNGGSRHRRRR